MAEPTQADYNRVMAEAMCVLLSTLSWFAVVVSVASKTNKDLAGRKVVLEGADKVIDISMETMVKVVYTCLGKEAYETLRSTLMKDVKFRDVLDRLKKAGGKN